jgi:GR25 family glycosyltransferase involved in LPS biosynthesis
MNKPTFDIYLINLDKDTDRLEKFKTNISPNRFIRIPGIHGNKQEFHDNQEVFFTSRYLAPKSALGCAMSHRLAAKTFLETSDKPFVLICEDDAEPLLPDYIEKIEESIKTAPADWDMIKYDYLPNYNIGEFNKVPSLILTAYLINKKGAEKLLKHKIYYFPDIEQLFFGLNIYNNPELLFTQIWDENNNSNNRVCTKYNPFCYISEPLNFKAIRLGIYEFTFADLILVLLFLVVFLIIIYRLFQYNASKGSKYSIG